MNTDSYTHLIIAKLLKLYAAGGFNAVKESGVQGFETFVLHLVLAQHLPDDELRIHAHHQRTHLVTCGSDETRDQ